MTHDEAAEATEATDSLAAEAPLAAAEDALLLSDIVPLESHRLAEFTKRLHQKRQTRHWLQHLTQRLRLIRRQMKRKQQHRIQLRIRLKWRTRLKR